MKLFIAFLIIVALAGKVFLGYLSQPIAGINQAGICKYLIIDGEKVQPCGRLPHKYTKESIAGWE